MKQQEPLCILIIYEMRAGGQCGFAVQRDYQGGENVQPGATENSSGKVLILTKGVNKLLGWCSTY